jgi:predicted  nucleic acid-binding Zn-ribbon protein
MIKCVDCEGSIDTLSGFCMDCGFDTFQYMDEMDEWVDSLPPVETYQDVA